MSKKIVLLSALAIGLASTSLAQDQREIQLESDSLIIRQIDGRSVSELVRPILISDGSKLTANFGRDEGDGYIRFWGDVVVVEEGDTLRTDRLRYDKSSKVSVAEGDVRLSDGEVVLQSPSATHYSDEDRTVFDEGVQYTDSLTILFADRAVYYTDTNMAVFSRNVRLVQDDLTLYADSVMYKREERQASAWGNIIVIRSKIGDSKQNYILGETLYRDARVDSIFVGGGAKMAVIDSAEADTLYVSAESLFLQGDDSLIATDSVLVSTSSYTVTGDSLSTITDGDDLQHTSIRGSPIAWLIDTQLIADSLNLISSVEVDSIFGNGNVFVASLDSLSGRIQQLKGQHLTLVMRQDSLRSMLIERSAESVFFLEREEGGQLAAYRGSGDGMRFDFVQGALNDVAFYTGVEGTYYPEHLFDQLSNLAGYIWEPDQRPDRDAIASEFWAEIDRRMHITSAVTTDEN